VSDEEEKGSDTVRWEQNYFATYKATEQKPYSTT